MEEQDLPVLRILTDRGTEYCGKAEGHDYQLYLTINQIDHTKTKVKSPQTNGICEQFHRTHSLNKWYQMLLNNVDNSKIASNPFHLRADYLCFLSNSICCSIYVFMQSIIGLAPHTYMDLLRHPPHLNGSLLHFN